MNESKPMNLDEWHKDLLHQEIVLRLGGTEEAELAVNHLEQAVLAAAGLADNHLLVIGDGDQGVIRFQGNRFFLVMAVEAVERLVEDILASERE